MTTSDVNLVDLPWITVLGAGGQTDEVSLTDAFARAEHITQIVGELPTQGLAILRLMLAILHRASGGPADLGHWTGMRQNWPDVARGVASYLRRFHDRFDLRHPSEPFFQVADLRTASDGVSGLEKLIADVPNGAPFQTTRLGRGIERISWAEAARWLVHVQAFDPSGIRSGAVGDPRVKGGKGYPIGPGWCGQIGAVHVTGDTLAETLMLNLVVPGAGVDVETGPADLPPWERAPLDQRPDPGNGGEPRGIIDVYTWQARRVRLVGDDDGVTGVVLAQGDKLTPQNRIRVEPLTGWRYSEPQTKKYRQTTYMPRVLDPERALWRGLNGLISQTEESSVPGVKRYLQPAVLLWLARLRHEELVTQRLVRLHAVGYTYGPQQSTFAELVDDSVVVPVALLVDAAVGQAALDAVESAERAAGELGRFARNLALAAGASNESEGCRERARAAAYVAVDGPFRAWLATLDGGADVRQALTVWESEVLQVVRRLGQREVERAATAAWRGRSVSGRHVDVGQSEAWFRVGLAKVLPLAHASSEAAREPEVLS